MTCADGCRSELGSIPPYRRGQVFLRSLAIVFAFLCLSFTARAADLVPSYTESIQMAVRNASSPSGWQPVSLYVIPDGGGTEGLFYDGGNLVVRTATKLRYVKSNYVGQAGYKIFGGASTDAAWVTVGNDATRFLLANGVNGSNVTTLLERGLGMDATGTHDAIIEYAVGTQYLLRPTRNPDISVYTPAKYGQNLPFEKPAGMSDDTFNNFKAYYTSWLAQAYGASPFPFTQLGYTFFWGNGTSPADINGMTEFILLGQTPVDIYGIYATGSYIYTRNDGTDFSTAATASYGNGFAGFKIDGACDTVWAGHRFQKNVRTAIATPNQIVIEAGGSVSGGEGLLVWSLNYDVINNGTISGATADKFGIAGTSNIAVLFKGDTSTTYGTPITTPGAVNRLTNAGTISSPGTAIRAEAGDTVIINNPGGTISGAVAIQTGSGNDTVTINGGRVAGTIDLGTGTDSVNMAGGAAARLDLSLNRDTMNTASIINVETVSIADNTNFGVTLAGPAVRNNDRFLVVDAGTLTATPANLVVLGDASVPMISFSAAKDGGKLYLVASRNDTYYRDFSGNPSLGASLDGLANSATGDLANVLGALDRSGSAGNALQLGPSADGDRGVVEAGFGTVGRFLETTTSRIDQVIAGNGPNGGRTGVSTGDEALKWGVWAQGFGSYLKQDPRDTSMGYTAHIWGTSLGLDRLVSDHSLFGVSGGFAKSHIRTSDSGTRTDADSYQGNLYASYFRDRWRVDGILSCAHNRYDGSRHIAFGGVDRTATGDYGGYEYSGYIEGGYTIPGAGWNITPLVSLRYSHLHLDGYTEDGAGSLNLSVDSRNYDMLQSGLGTSLSRPFLWQGSRLIPEFHLKWFYDFIGDRQQTTSAFTGGGASFSTEGYDPPRSSLNAGARLTLINRYGVTVSLNYDLELKKDFYSHAGYANIRFVF
ncbi:MAG: Outer membrane protein B precursor [Syntrophorhabdus sp. PtaB.Bin047]|nr:MAG: Outer membrane protein B precursor [Syntrophorhabdus sp. PtaB.Bin047]